ncbi:unnamed protein product [Linum trigynum]|uniref:Uncharacterized protein n=1 Tax=Linum trigynum TaxID=586398 RepID=A0AAV2DS58_9ROSI
MGRRPCCSKEGLNRGAWTAMEDTKLADYIAAHGEGKWRDLPLKAGLKRCGKSCRLRWLNYLRPGIKRGNITDDEAELIIRLHKLLGNRWSLIAGRLPGRTDNEIKNFWNTNLRKKQHHHNPQGTQDPTAAADHHEDHKPSSSKVVAIDNITPTNHDQSRSDLSSKAIRTKATRPCRGKAVFPHDHTVPSPILMPATRNNSDGSNDDQNCGHDGASCFGLSCDLEIDEELLSDLLQSTDFSWLIDDDLVINGDRRDGGDKCPQERLLEMVTANTVAKDDDCGDCLDQDEMVVARSAAGATSAQGQTSLIADVAAAAGTSSDAEGAGA